uniref:Uncharacterized protein n=1 Tax=Mus spicilegus TaxID=10103 RepID=A0A8C6G4Q3_MUSSI
CCFGQEGGRLSGAEDGAASEALWLSPVPETAGLCIPHPLPCSLTSAESRSQGGSRRSLRQKPLGPGGPLCSHQEGGRLSFSDVLKRVTVPANVVLSTLQFSLALLLQTDARDSMRQTWFLGSQH